MGIHEAPVPGPAQGIQAVLCVGHGADGLDTAVVAAGKTRLQGRGIQPPFPGDAFQQGAHGGGDDLPVDLLRIAYHAEGRQGLPCGGHDGGVGVHQSPVHVPNKRKLLHAHPSNKRCFRGHCSTNPRRRKVRS